MLEQSPQTKKFVWLIIFMVILAGGALAFNKFYKNSDKVDVGGKSVNNQPPKVQVSQTAVESTKLPEKFPTDLPLETGAKVTQNYTATTVSGVMQSTRVYETKKTLDENYKIYKDYLKKASWSIENDINEATRKILVASKGDSQMTIVMNKSETVSTIELNVSVAQEAPSAETK